MTSATIEHRIATMPTNHPSDDRDAELRDRLPYFFGAARQHGKVFHEPVDVVDAIEASGLDYIVAVSAEDVLAPVAVPGGVVNITMTGHKGVIRVNSDGTRGPLGVVKSAFRACQNSDGFEFAQSLIDDFDANVVAAAAYGNPIGSRAYLALRLNQTLMAGGKDPHDVYVIVTNAHDGNAALTARVAPIRRSTQAEITTSFAGAPMSYTLRHTGDLTAKMRDAVGTMSMVKRWISTYESATFALLAEPMGDVEFQNFAKRVLPTPSGAKERAAQQWAERRATLTHLFEKAPSQAFGRGTRYAAFTAFCEYVDYYSATRGGDPADVRAERLLSGRAARMKADAWSALA